MEQLETRTASGQGSWGGEPYEIALVTVRTTRRASDGNHAQTVTSYSLNVSNPRVGRRFFATEDERATFIDASFAEIALAPVSDEAPSTVAHPLAIAKGEPLSAVTFVTDYVQLSFGGGPPLNLYVWPRLHAGGAVYRRATPGYADQLISLIGATLTDIDELLDYGLVLGLAESTCLTVPLDGTDLVGPEVAEFNNRDSGAWMVWRPGDEPIAWLPEPD